MNLTQWFLSIRAVVLFSPTLGLIDISRTKGVSNREARFRGRDFRYLSFRII